MTTKPKREYLKHYALALMATAGLTVGSVQALTTSQTFDLGTSPASTNFPTTGIDSLVVWIAKGSLPAGSILRSVTATDLKLEAQQGNSWASDLGVFLDPTPETPGGPDGILKIGDDNNYGGALYEMNWDGAQNDGPATVSRTDADWAAPIDLSTVAVMLGNGYASDTAYSGTITVVYDVPEVAAIESFGPGAVVGPLSGNVANIAWTVPYGTDITTLSPTFTLSSGTCDKDNGGPTTYDFTNPVVYTVTDTVPDPDVVNIYTVTVTVADAVLWNVVGDGVWNESTVNWLTQPGASPTAYANGNEAIFDNTGGGTITIDPSISPSFTTISSGTYTFIGSPIAGGSLTNNGTLTLKTTPSDISSTTINGSLTYLADSGQGGFGTNVEVTLNNVTINSGGVLLSKRMVATGDLTLNGGTYREASGWGETWKGSTYLAADSYVNANGNGSLHLDGPISGPGGLTTDAVGNPDFAGVYLSGTNSYTGETIVNTGGLWCQNSSALGDGGALTIASGAVAKLNYTGTHVVSALTLGGVVQTYPGTYGSLTSDATFKSSYFTGTGTVTSGDPASAAFILSFGTNVAGSLAAIDPPVAGAAAISWLVPDGTDLATLAPDFTMSPGATCSDQISGVVPSPDFSAGPVFYTVVSQDALNTVTYTVTATTLPNDTSVTWNIPGSGNWNLGSVNWIGQPSNISRPYFDGANVIFNNTAGGTITIDPDMAPLSTTVSAASGTYTFSGGPIATGSLTKDGGGTLVNNGWNTYSGGTIIENGTLQVNWPGDSNPKTSLGSGPVTLNNGTLFLFRTLLANALIVNGGSLTSENGFGNNYTGPITLNGTLTCNMQWPMNCSGNISGTGGLTIGGSNNYGKLNLSGISSYAGATTVNAATLRCDSPDAVAGGDWIISGGKVNLNYSGTKNIASLTLGGVPKTDPGTYGSEASGADFQSDTYFTPGSTGTVTIGGASGYSTWADANAPGQTPGEDYDNDGVDNGIEYFMGQTGSSFTAMPGLDGTNTVTWTKDPAYDGTWQVQTSPDLSIWTNVAGTDNGTSVSYSLTPGEGMKFVRLLVTPTP